MLLRRDSSYPSTTCYGVAQHSVEAVQDVLQNVRPTAAGSVTDAFDDFVGYLMLDALIGNTDRHHENWAVISRRPDTHRAVLTLAPSYDHASSLGRELSDLKRRGRLDSSGRGTVANYAEKAWSAFHDPDGNKLTPLGALKRAANFRPRTFSLWQTLLRITPFDFFVAEVQRVPETRLSSVGKGLHCNAASAQQTTNSRTESYTIGPSMIAQSAPLFLAWQHAESRSILPVGRLVRIEGGYEYAYINAVRRAQELGFEPLVTFPELEAVYQCANLPPLFSNRVMRSSRPDFARHISELGLTLEDAEPMAVLALTGGRRATDRLEIFAPPTLMAERVEGVFLARGLRHIPDSETAVAQLQPGNPLYVLADLQNSVSGSALALRTEDKRLLGYVPDYLAQELVALGAPPGLLRVCVVRANPDPAPVHHRLVCRFAYPADPGVSLFSGQAYQPLSKDAAAVPARAA